MDLLGSFSSPRAADLNGDGIKDIVLGSGRHEFVASDSAILAFDGKDGTLLWNVHAEDQMFGSAVFMDITGDDSPEVFINGRSGELYCINGLTGEVIWEFFSEGGPMEAREVGLFNFYNPQFINDVTGDGVKDIVISNGGDVLAEPYNTNRPPGFIMIINAVNGMEVTRGIVPDKKETYMSVVAYDFNGDGSETIIYGTGGETIGGKLYSIDVTKLLKGKISKSKILAESESKGFIAPPILTDISKDGIPDIIAMAVDGRMIAINGKTRREIWTAVESGTEAYTSIGLGYFNSDDTYDFYTNINTGVWPDLDFTKSLVVSGSDGSIIKSDTIGYYSTISPLIADFNNDGVDDVLSNVNFPGDGKNGKGFYNTFTITDFATDMTHRYGPVVPGSNSASTPWLGDLDNDGKYDIVFIFTKDPLNISNFSGMYINRFNTEIEINNSFIWGSYMGSTYDGIFIQK